MRRNGDSPGGTVQVWGKIIRGAGCASDSRQAHAGQEGLARVPGERILQGF